MSKNAVSRNIFPGILHFFQDFQVNPPRIAESTAVEPVARAGTRKPKLAILRPSPPEYWGDSLARTLANAQLGNEKAARDAAADILAVWPDFETAYPGMGLEGWLFEQPGLIAHIIDGLEKAGLDMVEPYDPLNR